MALDSQSQGDWGGGMCRGRRRAPANSFYDGVNAIILDDGTVARRGGSAYFSTSDTAAAMTRIAAPYMPAPAVARPLALASGSRLYAFSAAGSPSLLSSSVSSVTRWVTVAGFAIAAAALETVVAYGGSLKTSEYSTGSVTMTAGSEVVTGSGTSWLANADAGMIFETSNGIQIVRSVDSNTQLTLMSASSGGTPPGGSYALRPVKVSAAFNFVGATGTQTYLAAAGAGTPRLIMTIGNRAYLSNPGAPFAIDGTIYHELPSGADLIGAEGVGDSVLLFAQTGVWRIDNLSLDPVDDFGNIQQSLTQVSKDIVLWGELGITGWEGGVIVPALDDVHVMAPDGSSSPITGDPQNEKIRRLYRSYVGTSGYQPGCATVHRGHYWLPILNGSTVVDVLVCRLDRGAAWTRWTGQAAGAGYAVQGATSSTRSKLLGVSSLRVNDLTGTLDPSSSNAQDADATNFDFTLTTRDYPTSPGNQPGFVQRARARYVLTDDGNGGTAAPTVSIAVSSDQDADVYATLTDKGQQGGGTGWGTSDGSAYQWATVGKKRDRIRYKITQTGAAASFIFRSLEQLIRPSGKQ